MGNKRNKNIKKKTAIRNDKSRLIWRKKRENDRKEKRIYKTGRGTAKIRERERAMK